MTAEPPRPTEAKASALERLLDYAFKNPFIAMWNLALIVGGFIALVYFTQIGYFPDLDLKSGSSFLIGIAFLGIFLSALLAIVFTVPSWMIRTEVWRNYLQLKERVPGMEPQPIGIEMERKRRLPFIAFASLHGLAAACFWLFIFGCFGIKAGHEEFANRIQWCAAIGGAACCILLRLIFRGVKAKALKKNLSPETLLGHHYFDQHSLLALLWIMVTPAFWLMALLGLKQSKAGSTVDLMIALVFVAVVIMANAVLSVLRLESRKTYVAYAFVSVGLPAIFLAMPYNPLSITKGVFATYSIGAMPHTAFVVKRPTCDAVNLLVPGTCNVTADPKMGCIKPARMANRVGSEFLLILMSGEEEIKVPIQKSDVLVWSSTSSSSADTISCNAKPEPIS